MRVWRHKCNVIPAYYNIDSKFLEFVIVYRDLGGKFDSWLNFHEHVREVVRKTGALSEYLVRSSVCHSSVIMAFLFISHIGPGIHVCSNI